MATVGVPTTTSHAVGEAAGVIIRPVPLDDATLVKEKDGFVDEVFEADYVEKWGEGSGFQDIVYEVVFRPTGERVAALMASYFWGGVVIDRLAVLPEHRNTGLGRYLLHRAMRQGWALGAGVACLETFEYQGVGYYERHGFVTDFVRTGFRDGRRFHYYSRPLDAAGVDGLVPVDSVPANYDVREVPPSDELTAFTRAIFKQQAMDAFGDHSHSMRWCFEAVLAASGARVGVIEGTAFWGAAFIKHLVVSRAARGKGVGSALLLRAMEHGESIDCTLACVETFSFQAEPFYLRHGFVVDHRRSGWKHGAKMSYMHRMLPPKVAHPPVDGGKPTRAEVGTGPGTTAATPP